jgi:hypothetical protein
MSTEVTQSPSFGHHAYEALTAAASAVRTGTVTVAEWGGRALSTIATVSVELLKKIGEVAGPLLSKASEFLRGSHSLSGYALVGGALGIGVLVAGIASLFRSSTPAPRPVLL